MSDTSSELSGRDAKIRELECANASFAVHDEWQLRRIALLERVIQDGWSWGQLAWAEERILSGHSEDVANAEVRGMLVGLVEIQDGVEPALPPDQAI